MSSESSSIQTVSKNVSKPHAKYRNIIFDIGRVLLEWRPEHIVSEIFKDEPDVGRSMLELTKTVLWKDLDRGTLDREMLDLHVEQHNVEHARQFLAGIPTYLVPIPEGVQIFKQCKEKGFKTYLLSNFAQEFDIVEARYDFLRQFDGGIISYRVRHIKPEPAIYQALLDTYQLDPNECLFIDDLEENIHGGRSMGIDGVVCKDHTQVLNELKALKVLD